VITKEEMIGMRKIISMTMAMFLVFTMIVKVEPQQARASSLKITISEFAEELAKEIGTSSDGISAVDVLINNGIIKTSDFTDYSNNLTRGDMLMLLSRADDYLYNTIIDDKLIKEAIEKRISDIGKISKDKREDVARGFIKGLMKGYSNGKFSGDRNLKLTNKVTKDGAMASLKLLKEKSLRAKISPDGQLIRTTNLPKYAKYFPYVLESYPNAYYDWQFSYEGQAFVNPETGKRTPFEFLEDYASPVDIDQITEFDNFKKVKEQYVDEWVNKVQTYMECVFNVDYRTIDDEWVNKILSADYSYGHETAIKRAKGDINKYIKNMKDNKTVVESSKIAVDKSSLYFCQGRYVLRTYVKYRIVSSNEKYGADADKLIYENPYGKILYTSYPLVNLNKYTLGEWKEGFFEVDLSWRDNKTPENIGVFYAILNEVLYNKRKVN
jgi:hypothetical protein